MNIQHESEIVVSARIGFDTVEEASDRLRGIDFPIELALPRQYSRWQAEGSKSSP